MAAPALKTEHFLIRAFERKDLDIFAQYRALSCISKYQSWTAYTYQDAVELFDNMDYSSFGSEHCWYQLAISMQDSDILIGDVAVHFIDTHQTEIGFTVSPEHQGKNVATEAVSALLHYLFDQLNIHRVVATTDVNNTASYRLLEKLGFRREGHLIQNTFFKGAWGSEYQYALLNSEYTNQ